MTMFEDDAAAARDATCQRVLHRFTPRIVPSRLNSLGNRGGFSGAAIWRVVTDIGDFALRRWPRPEDRPGLPRERILGLHRLLAHLQRDGLKFVAVPLPTCDGTTLPRESGDDWQLEPWLPGIADFHSRPTSERSRACLAALAKWHLSAERYVPDTASAEWFGNRNHAPSPAAGERMQVLDRVNAGLLDQIEKSIGRGLHADVNRGDVSGMIRELTIRILQLCRRGATRMADELRMVGDVRVRLHPCLRDVWHDHLLFTNDDLTGLIDPSACRMENVACDLSRLIGSLVGDDRSRWDFALAEYQRSRPLSLDELRLVGVLNRSGVLLSGWTWLEWIYLQQRTFPNPLAVIDRLNEIVRRLEILIAEDSSALSIK